MLGEYSASTANPSQIRTSSNPAQGMIACQKLKQKKKKENLISVCSYSSPYRQGLCAACVCFICELFINIMGVQRLVIAAANTNANASGDVDVDRC